MPMARKPKRAPRAAPFGSRLAGCSAGLKPGAVVAAWGLVGEAGAAPLPSGIDERIPRKMRRKSSSCSGARTNN